MSNESFIIEECARALMAARPFVLDGRPNIEAERVLPLVESALDLAMNYKPDEDRNK